MTAGQRRAPTTIAEVAELADVSIGTASKVLNGRGQLRVETRERVLAAAHRLGFQPNALARSLIAGRSYTVGLITTDSFGRFTIPIMLGVEDALGAGQISVFLCDGRDDQIREQHYIRTLLGRRVDGIVVTGRRADPRPPIGADLPVPIVYAMTQSTNPDDCSVAPDDEQGETRDLASARYRAHTYRPHHRAAAISRRSAACRRRPPGARRVGLSLADPGALHGEWSEAWGSQATHILLHASPDVDAIFCGSDRIARGIADALRESGRRIPDDIALVGYDNWEVIATGCRPPLTTVDMDLPQLGRSRPKNCSRPSTGCPRLGCTTCPAGW